MIGHFLNDWIGHGASRSSLTHAAFTCFVAVGAASTLGGCTGPLSTLQPDGPSARSIATLWWVMLAGGALLFGATMLLVMIAIARPGSAERVAPSKWLIGGGLVLPTLTLAPLLIYGLASGERLLARAGEEDAVRIDVTAEMWRFVFRYPQADGGVRESVDVMHIPTNQRVHVHLTSRDVIHSFWVPRLAGKLDAIPGHVNILRLLAQRDGVYQGVCTEFCGPGHAAMHMRVEAHAPEDYARALREHTSPAQGATASGQAAP